MKTNPTMRRDASWKFTFAVFGKIWQTDSDFVKSKITQKLKISQIEHILCTDFLFPIF